MSKLSVKREFVGSSVKGRRPAGSESQQRVPRVTKLMALAIVFDRMIRNGIVADQAEIAKLGRVTRARISQIMDLLILAPAIQEQLLDASTPAVTERRLRPIAVTLNWRKQIWEWESVLRLK